MKKKVIDLWQYKTYGRDALIKEDEELFNEGLQELLNIDLDSAQTFLQIVEDIKEQAKETNIPYPNLLEKEFNKYLEGLYVEKKKQTKVNQQLDKNKISEYIMHEDKLFFLNFGDYKKATFIVENI